MAQRLDENMAQTLDVKSNPEAEKDKDSFDSVNKRMDAAEKALATLERQLLSCIASVVSRAQQDVCSRATERR